MEINQPASEVSSHGSPDEQQVQSQSLQQPRSYECNFCKKGFSNAQALGGHMNIHRKDKAKLKQASKETHQRLMMDTSTLTPSRSTKPLDVTSGQVKSNAKWLCVYSSDDLHESSYPSPRDGSHVSELKQLPLFVDEASRPDHYSNPIIHASANWQEELHSSNGSFGAEVLDLELRLGHEPPKSSLAAGTRKFF